MNNLLQSILSELENGEHGSAKTDDVDVAKEVVKALEEKGYAATYKSFVLTGDQEHTIMFAKNEDVLKEHFSNPSI